MWPTGEGMRGSAKAAASGAQRVRAVTGAPGRVAPDFVRAPVAPRRARVVRYGVLVKERR